MSLEVAWRLMFRANDASAADRCLSGVLDMLTANVTDAPKPYWKRPELWEVSLCSPFASPPAQGVFELLALADRLATGWLVSGPLFVEGNVTVFDGVFNVASGRPHVPGLEWASFTVVQLSAANGA